MFGEDDLGALSMGKILLKNCSRQPLGYLVYLVFPSGYVSSMSIPPERRQFPDSYQCCKNPIENPNKIPWPIGLDLF